MFNNNESIKNNSFIYKISNTEIIGENILNKKHKKLLVELKKYFLVKIKPIKNNNIDEQVLAITSIKIWLELAIKT